MGKSKGGVAPSKAEVMDKELPKLKDEKKSEAADSDKENKLRQRALKSKELPSSKGNKTRLEVLRVSQKSSVVKSLKSPASLGRGQVKRVLRKKSASDQPKLSSKTISSGKHTEEKQTACGDNASKLDVKRETVGARNGSPGQTGLMYPGWHASAAGGVHHAVEAAARVGARSFGLFLRPQRTWKAPPLRPGVADQFQALCAQHSFPPHLILPHGSYLLNLASPNSELREKSISMLTEEMVRCQQLGLTLFNIHPGSTCGKISRQEGIRLVAEGINRVHKETSGSVVKLVLENMCCQGDTLGGDFKELKLIIDQVEDKTRIGVCLDTCHAMAAGYDLSVAEGFEKFCSDFETLVGWQWLVGVHVNDSLGPAGSHRDRHANIGHGMIGEEGFRRILNCSHFADLPMILETPPQNENVEEGYRAELELLRGLVEGTANT